ncbi:MAG: hypothetical protein QM784_36450 [Polyangiaceae bacterium]
MLPNTGERTKINAMEIDVTVPIVASARSGPTTSRTQIGRYIDTTPIEKMVLAKSYRTQATTPRRLGREGSMGWDTGRESNPSEPLRERKIGGDNAATRRAVSRRWGMMTL